MDDIEIPTIVVSGISNLLQEQEEMPKQKPDFPLRESRVYEFAG